MVILNFYTSKLSGKEVSYCNYVLKSKEVIDWVQKVMKSQEIKKKSI